MRGKVAKALRRMAALQVQAHVEHVLDLYAAKKITKQRVRAYLTAIPRLRLVYRALKKQWRRNAHTHT